MKQYYRLIPTHQQFYIKIMENSQIKKLKKEIKDLFTQRDIIKLLIKEYADKSESLRNMTWIPNVVPGTDELHFNKWKSFSIAANKKALKVFETNKLKGKKCLKYLIIYFILKYLTLVLRKLR